MLENVYDAVVADFKRSSCPARNLFGFEFLNENAEPNRVVWVPSSDGAFTPPVPSVTPLTRVENGQYPQSILTRNAGCDLYIWGAATPTDGTGAQTRADYGVANALVNQTILSLYRAAGFGRVGQIIGGKWTTASAFQRRGFQYELRIQIAIPILDIDFPCGCIDTSVFTWLTQDDVSANVTVEMRGPVPTSTLMSSTNFIVSGED
jgi:hypothetical protein